MAKVPIPMRQATRKPRPKLVHQFLVVLSGTDPLVWRRIQVPEKYSFWDLHVAIQDAAGEGGPPQALPSVTPLSKQRRRSGRLTWR